MSNIVTGTVTGLVDNSDILAGEGDIRREAAVGFCDLGKTVMDVGSHNRDQNTQYFIATQQFAFQNATAVAALKAAADQQFALTQAAIQLSAEKNAAATALASAATQMLIVQENVKTRELLEKTTIEELRFKLARSQDRNDDRGGHGGHGKGGCGCQGTLKYGPPLAAEYPVQV